MDISVVTPFHRGNAYMEQLFGCVRKNAERAPQLSIELILVNDSLDCPIEYDESWVRGFTLRILTNEQNCGIHRTRVNGLLQAQGTFIQFLDQDDTLADDALASQFPLAQDVDVVVANGFDQNPCSYGPIYRSVSHQQQAILSRYYYSVGNQIVSPGHCLIRKDAIPSEWLTHAIRCNGSDDLLLWLMMFARNCRWAINPALLYTHVYTGKNVSANINKICDSSMEVLEILKKGNWITAEQAHLFLRSRNMSRIYESRSKLKKIFAMLCYPDVARERLHIYRCKKQT